MNLKTFLSYYATVAALTALAIGGAVAMSIILTGCATTSATTPVTTASGTVAVPTQTVSIGYEIENYLQEFNTGLTAALPTVDSFLAATDNSKDTATVNMYASLASLAASVAQAGLAAGLPPQQVQAQVNTALTPANAATAAANAVTAPAPTPAVPTTLNLRPIYGERDAYATELSGHKRTINYQPE